MEKINFIHKVVLHYNVQLMYIVNEQLCFISHQFPLEKDQE